MMYNFIAHNNKQNEVSNQSVTVGMLSFFFAMTNLNL